KIVFAGKSAALGSLLFWFRHLKDDPNVLFCKALLSHIYLNLLTTPPEPAFAAWLNFNCDTIYLI
nr:hypothetical protein [Anaerolineaceae bacterium]